MCTADYNYFQGVATLQQKDMTGSQNEVVSACATHAATNSNSGFFYQMHSSDHQICGFYDISISVDVSQAHKCTQKHKD